MKRFFYMGMIALVALMATSLVSCSKDDDKEDEFAFDFKFDNDGDSIPSTVFDAVMEHYKSVAGSDTRVDKTSDSTFWVICPISKKADVQEKLTGADMTALESKLDGLFKRSYFHLIITLDGGKKFTYDYEMSPAKLLPGTYKATGKDKEEYEIKIEATNDFKVYNVEIVADNNLYDGKATYDPETEMFDYDSVGQTPALMLGSAMSIYNAFYHGVTKMNLLVELGDKSQSIDFVRQ